MSRDGDDANDFRLDPFHDVDEEPDDDKASMEDEGQELPPLLFRDRATILRQARAGAGLILDGKEREGQNIVLEAIWDYFVRRIGWCLDVHGVDDGDGKVGVIVHHFFERHLDPRNQCGQTFLHGLRNLEALAYLERASVWACYDFLRQEKSNMKTYSIEETPDIPAPPDPQLLNTPEPDPRAMLLREVLDACTPADRLLLKIYYSHLDLLENDELAGLAQERSVSVDQIQAELAARNERTRIAILDAEEKRAFWSSCSLKLQQRISWTRQMILARDGRILPRANQVSTTEGLEDAEEAVEDRGDDLYRMTPEQRSAYYYRLLDRAECIAKYLRKHQATTEEVEPDRPLYEEVACILGLQKPDDPPEVRKTAQNTVNQQILRLRRKLKQAIDAKSKRRSS